MEFQKMKTLDMTKGTPLKLILRFAVPLFIGILFQQAYNFADTMIVGRGLGDTAVAAVGSTSALYGVLIHFANGMNNGFGIVLSRMFGAKDYEGMKKAAATMIVLDGAVVLVLTSLSLPMLKMLLVWLDTPADIFGQAYQYIFIILAGMFSTIAYNMGAGFMRAVGNSRTPLFFLILSCGLNVSMDILFIFGLKLGVMGAAMATVFAQVISALLSFGYIYRNYAVFLPGKKDWRLEKELAQEMLSTGLSMGLMLSVFSLGSIILQKGVNMLGTRVITAHTAARRIQEMQVMPLSAIASANATFVGQNYGAKEYGRIKTSLKQVIGAELCLSLAGILISYTAGRWLVGLLLGTNDAMVLDYGVLNTRVTSLFFFPLGILLVLRNAMQPMGYKIAPVVSSSIELAVKVLFTFLLIPRVGYPGVVVTEPIIWVCCAVFLGIVYIGSEKKRRKGNCG